MLDPDRWFTRLYFLRPPAVILDGYFNIQAQQQIRTQAAAQIPVPADEAGKTSAQALIQGVLDDQSTQYAPTLYDQDVRALRGAFRDYIDSVYNLDGRDTLWMPGYFPGVTESVWVPGGYQAPYTNGMVLPVSTMYANSDSSDIVLVSRNGSMAGAQGSDAGTAPYGAFDSGVTLETVFDPPRASNTSSDYASQANWPQTNIQYLVRPGTPLQSLIGTFQYTPDKQNQAGCNGTTEGGTVNPACYSSYYNYCISGGGTVSSCTAYATSICTFGGTVVYRPTQASYRVNSGVSVTNTAFRICYFTRPVSRVDGFVNLPMARQGDLLTGVQLVNNSLAPKSVVGNDIMVRQGGWAGQPVDLAGLKTRFSTLEARGYYGDYSNSTGTPASTYGFLFPLFPQTPFAPLDVLVNPVVTGYGPTPGYQVWAIQEIRGMQGLTGWLPDGVTFETMCLIPGWRPAPGRFQDYEAVPFRLMDRAGLRQLGESGGASGVLQPLPLTAPVSGKFQLVGMRYSHGDVWCLQLRTLGLAGSLSAGQTFLGYLQSCLIGIPLEAAQLPVTPTRWSKGGGSLWGPNVELCRPYMDNYLRSSYYFANPGYPSYGVVTMGRQALVAAGGADTRDFSSIWEFSETVPGLEFWLTPSLSTLPAPARDLNPFRMDQVVAVDPDQARGGRFHVSGWTSGQDLYGRDLEWKQTEVAATSLESTLFALKNHPALQAPQWTELDQVAVGSLTRGFRTRDASGFTIQDRTAKNSAGGPAPVPYLYVTQSGRLHWVAAHLCAADRAVRKRSRILSLGCWTVQASPVNPQQDRYGLPAGTPKTTFQWITNSGTNYKRVTHSRTLPWVVFRQQYLDVTDGKLLGWAGGVAYASDPWLSAPGAKWCPFNLVDPQTRLWLGGGAALPDQIGCLQGFTLGHAQFLSGAAVYYPDGGYGLGQNVSHGGKFLGIQYQGSYSNQRYLFTGSNAFYGDDSSGFTTEVTLDPASNPCFYNQWSNTDSLTCKAPPASKSSVQLHSVYLGCQPSDPWTSHQVKDCFYAVKFRLGNTRTATCYPSAIPGASISTGGITSVSANWPQDNNTRPSDGSPFGFSDPGPTVLLSVTPPKGLTPTRQVAGLVGHGSLENGRVTVSSTAAGTSSCTGNTCGWYDYSVVAAVSSAAGSSDVAVPVGACSVAVGDVGIANTTVWREFKDLGPTYQFPTSDMFLPLQTFLRPTSTPGDETRNKSLAANGCVVAQPAPLLTGWHPNMYRRLYADESPNECAQVCGACPVPRLLGAALPLYRPLFLSDHQPTRGWVAPGLPYCPQGLVENNAVQDPWVLDGSTQTPHPIYWLKVGETVQFMHAGGAISTFSNLAPLVGTPSRSGDLIAYQAVSPGEDVLVCADQENQVQERFLIRVFATQVVIGISSPVPFTTGSTSTTSIQNRAYLWCLTPGAMLSPPEARAAALFAASASGTAPIAPGLVRTIMPAQVETFQAQELYQVAPVTNAVLATTPLAAGVWKFRVWEVPESSTATTLVFDSTAGIYKAGSTSGPAATLAYEFPHEILAVQLTTQVSGNLVTCTCPVPVEVQVGFFGIPPSTGAGTQSVPYQVPTDDSFGNYPYLTIQYLATQTPDMAGRLTASADRMTWTFDMTGWNPPESQLPGWIRANLCARVPDTRNWFSGVPFRDFKNPWYDGSMPA